MKAKILLLSVIAALLVYSCSSDRDDEVKAESSKLELKILKTNKGETSRTGDTIVVPMQQSAAQGSGLDPQFPKDPNENEGDDPKNVPPRK